MGIAERKHGYGVIATYFKVALDGHEIATFTSIDGPNVEVIYEEKREGGLNDATHKVPSGLKFANVKLSRPLDGDSAKLLKWAVDQSKKPDKSTVSIEAISSDGKETIAKWTLGGAFPSRYTGPSFSVEGLKPAMETLEITFESLMD